MPHLFPSFPKPLTLPARHQRRLAHCHTPTVATSSPVSAPRHRRTVLSLLRPCLPCSQYGSLGYPRHCLQTKRDIARLDVVCPWRHAWPDRPSPQSLPSTAAEHIHHPQTPGHHHLTPSSVSRRPCAVTSYLDPAANVACAAAQFPSSPLSLPFASGRDQASPAAHEVGHLVNCSRPGLVGLVSHLEHPSYIVVPNSACTPVGHTFLFPNDST